MKTLTKEQSEDLLICLQAEQIHGDIDISEYDMNFFGKVVKKRIDVLNLPISFTNLALLSLDCFCEVTGEAVVVLIECLDKYYEQTVTVKKLCLLYPNGFYTKDEFEKYVETKIKTGQIKFSTLY
jgi:hypothetical protein